MTPPLHRLGALTVTFIGLLIGFSAFGFAAQARPGPAAAAAIAGLAVSVLGTRWLWRLPPAEVEEELGPGSTP
jgi:membrane associated rhomboid family serine protease